MMHNDLISIVIPVFNEAENINLIYHQIKQELNSYHYEILFVNDGSTDQSWDIISTLSEQNPCVKAINFTRNFGYQKALSAGYDYATGDAIITMDCDLQHPPSVLPKMIAEWKNKWPIVYARRLSRKDPFLKRFTAKTYYNILKRIAEIDIPNVSDFRLIDKKVLRYIHKCQERSRFFRGIIAWSGFKYTFVDFNQPDRRLGETKFSLKKMFNMAWDGIFGNSLFPLKVAAYLGFFVIISAFVLLFIITIDSFFYDGYYPLFKWLVTIIYLFLGFLFILLWILGEYIGRLFEQLKGRPIYIVAETKNIERLHEFS